MSYDPVRRSFSGTVENETAQTVCSVQIELNLKQGTCTVVELGPSPVGDLAPGASATTELLVDDEPLATGVAFDAWEIHPEMFDCDCPSGEGGGEGGEGGEDGEDGGDGGTGEKGAMTKAAKEGKATPAVKAAGSVFRYVGAPLVGALNFFPSGDRQSPSIAPNRTRRGRGRRCGCGSQSGP